MNGTLVFNKHPGPETFNIKYKPGTPITDNLRKLEYEFGQQKVGPGSTTSMPEAENMLNEGLSEGRETAK